MLFNTFVLTCEIFRWGSGQPKGSKEVMPDRVTRATLAIYPLSLEFAGYIAKAHRKGRNHPSCTSCGSSARSQPTVQT